MSRSKLSNTDLRFYTSSGGSDAIQAKIKGTTQDSLVFEGTTSATKVTLKNVANPSGTGEVATWDYVNTKVSELQNGLTWKAPVKCKTDSNLAATLAGSVLTVTSSRNQLTFDGQSVNLNDRVLISEQTDQKQNGIYVCTDQGGSSFPTFARASDSDSAAAVESSAVFIEQGTNFKDTGYVQTTDSVTLGVSNIVWAQFSTVGEIVPGNALNKTGNTLDVRVDNTTLEIETNNLSIKDLGVTADKVATNTLTGNQIEDGSLTDIELADDACIERVIADNAVVEAKIKNNAVTSNKIRDGAVNVDKLESDAVTTIKVLDLNITTEKLANGAVSSDKLGSLQILGTHFSSGCVDSDAIGQGQVKNIHIDDGVITHGKLGFQSVTSAKIFPLNVLTGHIANNQITTALIASNQINSGHMKVNSVETDAVADSAITSNKIANNAITTSKIGTLSGLTVNGVVNATSFVATSGSGEGDNGFALPKSKTLSINFSQDQALVGNDTYVTLGDETDNAAIHFSFDDNITFAIAFAAYRVQQTGTNPTILQYMYEMSTYNSAGVAQPYTQQGFDGQYSLDMNYAPGGGGVADLQATQILGSGSDRIAKIRLRVKHNEAGANMSLTDTAQLTVLAVDDTSGNTEKTYSGGSLS